MSGHSNLQRMPLASARVPQCVDRDHGAGDQTNRPPIIKVANASVQATTRDTPKETPAP